MTTPRRTYIGKLNGNFVVRTTLPGYDTVNDDVNDPNKFSFSSDWTDLCAVHVVGIAQVVSQVGVGGTGWATYPFPALGYTPFAEVRWLSGSIIYDDTTPVTATTRHSGFDQWVKTDSINFNATGATSFYSLYAIFKIPVPGA